MVDRVAAGRQVGGADPVVVEDFEARAARRRGLRLAPPSASASSAAASSAGRASSERRERAGRARRATYQRPRRLTPSVRAAVDVCGPSGDVPLSRAASGRCGRARPGRRRSASSAGSPTLASICSGLVAPAITEATAGCASEAGDRDVDRLDPALGGERFDRLDDVELGVAAGGSSRPAASPPARSRRACTCRSGGPFRAGRRGGSRRRAARRPAPPRPRSRVRAGCSGSAG